MDIGGSFRFEGYEIELDGSLRFPRSVGPLTALGIMSPYGSGHRLPRSTMQFSLRRQDRFGAGRVEEASVGFGYEWPGDITQEWMPVELTVIRRDAEDSDRTNRLLLESIWRAETSGGPGIIDSQYRIAADAAVGTEVRAATTFVRLDTDSRVYVPVVAESILAARLRAGAGRAGGEGTSLPEARRFVVGGSTGLRGFAPGSFGPGPLPPVEGSDASGELRLEGSIEYRFGIAGWVKGAVFADAGNAWMLSGDDAPLHGIGRIFAETAANVGAGIRVDPEVLVVRLDIGVPVRQPWRDPAERWVTGSWDFSDPDWRQENVIINLAIGYPF